LVVPLVGAGRRDLYSGYFRADSGGVVTLLAAPRVGPVASVIEGTREALVALPSASVRFVGPGAERERAALEAEFPGSTRPAWREDGLSALDLAKRAHAGIQAPLYVRAAQAEERVRHRVLAAHPPVIRALTGADVPAVAALERLVFADPWPESFFLSEIAHPLSHARLAEQDGVLAGYCLAWLGEGAGHLGNLAVAPEFRRRGIATALLAELLERAREQEVEKLTLEVRVSNFPAQWFYRAHAFRLAGLRRRYYRDNQEDALIMEWRGGA